MSAGFGYVRAESVDDALARVNARHPAYAGGTDLLPRTDVGLDHPVQLVDIKRAGLPRAIEERGDRVALGALVTLAEVERSPLLAGGLQSLRDAAGLAATPQIRHRATLGGNLLQRPRCWYFREPDVECWLQGGDTCFAREGEHERHAIFEAGTSPCIAVHPSDLAAALVALGATVRLASTRRERTIEVAELFAPPTPERRTETVLAADELVTEIEVPTSASLVSTYRKAMDRKVWAFALAGVAVAAQLGPDGATDVRVVLSGVANVPRRAAATEAVLLDALRSGPIDGAAIELAAASALDGATPLPGTAYKVPLVRALVARALRDVLVSATR